MTATTKIEVRGVLAGAYVSLKNCLTHAVVVGADGRDVRVLCSRVKLDNMCDLVEEGAPTCPTCAKRMAKMGGAS
jgi:hypothetical protein